LTEIQEFRYKFGSHIVCIKTNRRDINDLYIDNQLMASDSFPSSIKILTADISFEKSITAIIRNIKEKTICCCIAGRMLNPEPVAKNLEKIS